MNNLFALINNKFAPISERIGQLWGFLTDPHPSITEVGERRRAQLLSSLSLIFVVSFLLAIISNPRTLVDFFIFLGITLVSYLASRTKYYEFGAYFFSFALTSVAFINIYNGSANSVDTSLASIVPISLILASAILTQRGFLILGIATFISTATIRIYADPKFLADPLFSYGRTIGTITSISVVLYGITLFRASVERDRLKEVREINRELEAMSTGLEQRVVERTKALETSAEVSRRLAAVLNPNQLAGEVVNEIRNAFNYYYAQIYLFDDTEESLVLRAGTGEAGRAMLERGHSLPKGRGLVGRAAENNQSVLVPDTSADPDWLPNEFLPDTKAEAAIPIAVGDQVLGVLDVQDDVANDIDEGDVTLLESLAGQVAISLRNAELYNRAEIARLETQNLLESATEGILVLDLTNGLFSEPNESAARIYGLPLGELVKVGPAQMSPATQPDGRNSTEKAMEMIGIAMEKGSNIFEWNHINGQGDEFPAEIRLVRLPGDKPRLRVTVIDISERKRLEEQNRKRAEQQTALNLITQKIQAADTIEKALQVAARELGHVLGSKQTLVTLDRKDLAEGRRETETVEPQISVASSLE